MTDEELIKAVKQIREMCEMRSEEFDDNECDGCPMYSEKKHDCILTSVEPEYWDVHLL